MLSAVVTTGCIKRWLDLNASAFQDNTSQASGTLPAT